MRPTAYVERSVPQWAVLDTGHAQDCNDAITRIVKYLVSAMRKE